MAGDRDLALTRLSALIELEPDNDNLKKRRATYRYVVPRNMEAQIVGLFRPFTPGEEIMGGQFIRIEIRDAQIIAHTTEPCGGRAVLRIEHREVQRKWQTHSPSFSLSVSAQNPGNAAPVSQSLGEAIKENDDGSFPWALAADT